MTDPYNEPWVEGFIQQFGTHGYYKQFSRKKLNSMPKKNGVLY